MLKPILDKCVNGSYFEIVQFGDPVGGDVIEERKYAGPLDKQINNVISYLDSLTSRQYIKNPGKAEVDKVNAFPFEAMEEVIVNAAYHRSYDGIPEPTKVYLYPDRMEIISYPGPVPGLKIEDFQKVGPVPPFPQRNRRVGEFLKELRLAEMRSTGIPKIKKSMGDNGSSAPLFEFDENRSYFKVTLPAHPKYLIIHTLRESAYLWSIGERQSSKALLTKVFQTNPASGALAGQLIEYLYSSGETAIADDIFQIFHKQHLKSEEEQPYLRYFKCLIGDNKDALAKAIIGHLERMRYYNDPVDIAVAFKRVKEYEKAHVILSQVFHQFDTDFEYLRNFAEVKISLSNDIYYSRKANWSTIRRLQREARELLERSIPLCRDNIAKAWCYFNLARCRNWLNDHPAKIDDAYKNAMDLLPEERAFRESFDKWQRYNKRRS